MKKNQTRRLPKSKPLGDVEVRLASQEDIEAMFASFDRTHRLAHLLADAGLYEAADAVISTIGIEFDDMSDSDDEVTL
jgi:hypothetical protein